MPVFRNASWAQRVAPHSGARVDLTDVPLRMQIKATRGASASALVTLTTGNGINMIDAPNGVLDLVLTEQQTALLPAGTLYFDVIRTDTHARLFGGRVLVEEGVTT